MRRIIRHRWAGLGLLVMSLAALVLFMYGFFPLKCLSGELSQLDDLPNFIDGISIDGQQVYNSGENTVVLMVIDGVRYDFLTEEYMPYSGQLLNNKSACIYVCVVELPSFTIPRIKAMMTGRVTTFADLALNLGAPAVHGDSVLRVAHSIGRICVLYGDDTCLRLFPGTWKEYDVISSFWVNDYTEVDNNVSRHLDKILAPDEKKKPTFDFLVLHYVGLDHIGHLEGSRSPKIKSKLLEMDEVVKKIFTAMQQWDRSGVLLVCGDHGMRDEGSHGGDTPSELLVPLLVARSTDFSCPYPQGRGPTVAQVDIAPTISWLLGGPLPADSDGRILPALLPQDIRQHLYLLHVIADHNSKHMPSIDTELYMQLKRAEKQFAHFLVTGQQSAAKISKEFYEKSLEKMAERLAKDIAKFDMFAIGIAIVLLCLIATALLCATLYSLQPDCRRSIINKIPRPHLHYFYGSVVAFVVILLIFTAMLVMLCYITETKSQICSFTPVSAVSFTATVHFFTITYYVIRTGIEEIKDLSSLNHLNIVDYLLISGTIFYSFSFNGTSYIDEEHMTWYFMWNTLMFFVLVRTWVIGTGATEVQDKPELNRRIMTTVGVGIVPKWVMLIALHRYLRTINQTGRQWLLLPDTAQWLNAPENTFYLQAHLVIGSIATLVLCIYNLRHMNNILHIHTGFTIAATACILCYRIATHALESPFEDMKTWDPVNIVSVIWIILSMQFVFEILSYMGAFKKYRFQPLQNQTLVSNNSVYNKPKAKTEDYFYNAIMDEPWNVDSVKMKLVRSASHLMLNDMMLIIILLMRPHNVILVPSIYVTCALSSKCMDHKLLDSRSGNKTEVVDILSRTLVHLWIGMLFYFYQGNSNGLASVDLGAGFVGLREYCLLRVGTRMVLHTYAGPALAGASLFAGLAAQAETWHLYLQQIWRATTILALHRVYSLVIYCIVAIKFRHHLFAWTVFAPKVIYDFVATIFSVQTLGSIAQIEVLAHITNWLARICTSSSKP